MQSQWGSCMLVCKTTSIVALAGKKDNGMIKAIVTCRCSIILAEEVHEYIGTFFVCEYWQLTVDDLSCNTALELPLVFLLHWLDAYDASNSSLVTM